MITIGIGHRAQQGKTLFAETIAEKCDRIGMKCKTYSISHLIVEYAIEHGHLPPNTTREACTPEQEQILVEIGNQKRAESPWFWTDQIEKFIEIDKPQVALLPNVRFVTEANFVAGQNGFNVRVSMLNTNGTRFICPTRNPNDQTETSLEFWPWNFEILNMRGRPYWLRRQAIALFEYLVDGAE